MYISTRFFLPIAIPCRLADLSPYAQKLLNEVGLVQKFFIKTLIPSKVIQLSIKDRQTETCSPTHLHVGKIFNALLCLLYSLCEGKPQ